MKYYISISKIRLRERDSRTKNIGLKDVEKMESICLTFECPKIQIYAILKIMFHLCNHKKIN